MVVEVAPTSGSRFVPIASEAVATRCYTRSRATMGACQYRGTTGTRMKKSDFATFFAGKLLQSSPLVKSSVN